MKKPFSITINEDIVDFIDEYGRKHKLKNRSAIIERLISYFIMIEEFSGIRQGGTPKIKDPEEESLSDINRTENYDEEKFEEDNPMLSVFEDMED